MESEHIGKLKKAEQDATQRIKKSEDKAKSILEEAYKSADLEKIRIIKEKQAELSKKKERAEQEARSRAQEIKLKSKDKIIELKKKVRKRLDGAAEDILKEFFRR
jgi:F0F1-type ATP synthase membrane subunit b/b'